MATNIVEFTAAHKNIHIEHHFCFIWHQEAGEIDLEMILRKIAMESSVHFSNMLTGGQ